MTITPIVSHIGCYSIMYQVQISQNLFKTLHPIKVNCTQKRCWNFYQVMLSCLETRPLPRSKEIHEILVGCLLRGKGSVGRIRMGETTGVYLIKLHNFISKLTLKQHLCSIETKRLWTCSTTPASISKTQTACKSSFHHT